MSDDATERRPSARRSTRWRDRWPTAGCPTRCWSTRPDGPSPPATRTGPAPRRSPSPARCCSRSSTPPGVLLHTNLGRAPLARLQGATYSNLELDLADRRTRVAIRLMPPTLMAQACGAEAGLVVNNGAAAVLLVLAALARGRGVIVSRGELVEIGGGFRVPEVMAESGARLVEVGTTNRTRRDDYDTGARRSRCRRGARDEGPQVELPHRGLHRGRRPSKSSRGSGTRLVRWWSTSDRACSTRPAPGCPTVRRPGCETSPQRARPWPPAPTSSIFSGDKLLGGPQAGRHRRSGRSRRDVRSSSAGPSPAPRRPRPRRAAGRGPRLSRPHRPALAVLADGDRAGRRPRARGPRRSVSVHPVPTVSVTGGGTLPGRRVPSAGIAIDGDRTAGLRAFQPPVIARVQDGRTILDLRTVEPADDATVADAARAATRSAPSSSATDRPYPADDGRRPLPPTVREPVPADRSRPWTVESAMPCTAGPSAALLAGAAQSALGDGMFPARLTVELLRPVPVAPLTVETEVTRPGRKVRLVAVRLRAAETVVASATSLGIRTAAVAVPEQPAASSHRRRAEAASATPCRVDGIPQRRRRAPHRRRVVGRRRVRRRTGSASVCRSWPTKRPTPVPAGRGSGRLRQRDQQPGRLRVADVHQPGPHDLPAPAAGRRVGLPRRSEPARAERRRLRRERAVRRAGPDRSFGPEPAGRGAGLSG